jgi:hypothetical protein
MMPTLSSFSGIVVRMYFEDHPPPHFRVFYGDERAQIAIDTHQVLQGALSEQPLALVQKWAKIHRQELRGDWRRAGEHQRLLSIDPLK